MQKLRGEQTNIEEELLELQEGIEATANKVHIYIIKSGVCLFVDTQM